MDALAMLLFLAVAVGMPALGWVLLIVDFRRWLRSLRRALVATVRLAPSTPYWELLERPPCLASLDLSLPCTEAEVLEAYRQKVKQLHPDRGGSMDQFLRLQKHFEQAVELVRQQAGRSG